MNAVDAMLLVKSSVLLSAALLAACLLRRASAVVHHRLWSFAFAGLIALPLAALAAPPIHVPVPGNWPGPPTGEPSSAVPARADGRGGKAAADPMRIGLRGLPAATRTTPTEAAASLLAPIRIERALAGCWLLGTVAAVTALLLSLIRVRILTRRGDDVLDADWRAAAERLAKRVGLRDQVRLILSGRVQTPMAGGLWRPVVFLPTSARAWSAECRDVVLTHELAHLAGRDPLRHVVARLAVALYWFHPLAWIAARQSSAARERACDETVLRLGTRRSAYAQVLLDLSASTRSSGAPLAALPMIQRPLLEKRVMAILNDDLPPATRARVLMPAVAVALLTLSVGAAQPAVRDNRAPAAAAKRAMDVSLPVATSTPDHPPSLTDAATAAVPAAQTAVRDSSCWSDDGGRGSFSGLMSSDRINGRNVVYEQIGTSGADRIIRKSFGDLRLCMLAEGEGADDRGERPSQWSAHARRVVMESRRGGSVQRLEIADGGRTQSWHVGSSERAVDVAAERWRDRMLAVLDTTWEAAVLRGNVSSLRGQISSIHGEESSLRGQISSLGGEVSSMRGHASSVRGEESSLRGQISSIQGHVSSLEGAISSERGSISALNAARYDSSDRNRIPAEVARHDAEIARLEREIRDYGAETKIAAVERQLRALDADGKVDAIEKQIRDFDLDGKVAAIERRIEGLEVDKKIADIERQIDALDADRRIRDLEGRRDADLKQLEAAIAAIR